MALPRQLCYSESPRWLERVRPTLSGRGSAWLERLVRDQEVGGSNPLAPTTSKPFPLNTFRLLLRVLLHLHPCVTM